MKIIIPNKLKKGDTVAVIAPSDPIEKEDLEAINQSILLMEGLGFKMIFGKYAFSNTTGYGATAKEKAEDINRMFQNREVKAILCAKGGNNCSQTFDYLDFEAIQNNPKIFCGFSDTTSLLNIIYAKTGLVTFHGSTFKAFTSWETEYGWIHFVKCCIEGSLRIGEPEKETYETIQEGMAEGILIGGNLTLFSNLLLGKYQVDVKDKILFLEELGWESEPAAVSRCFYYLKQNEVFDKIKGIWLGNYTHESNLTIEKILKDTIGEEYSFPIIKSENFGHIDKKAMIPLGIKARMDTSRKTKIELLEPSVK